MITNNPSEHNHAFFIILTLQEAETPFLSKGIMVYME